MEAQRSKIIHTVFFSKTYITSFSRVLLLSTSNVRMSEGTFCRVEVHIILLDIVVSNM